MSDTNTPPDPLPPTVTPSDWRGDFLAKATVGLIALVVVLVFLLAFLSAFGLKPDASFETVVIQVITTVLGFGGILWGFQFGSSKGSQAKDAQIAALTPPSSNPTP